MEIECKKCGQVKDVSHFSEVKNRKRGYHVWCKECLKKYDHDRHQNQCIKIRQQKKYRRILLQEWIRKYKLSLHCSRCPENDPSCLDFHHIEKSGKDFSIADAISKGYSIKRIESEMKKCIVLCANCHRKEHAK